MMSVSTPGHFNRDKVPTIKEIWRWIRQLVEDFYKVSKDYHHATNKEMGSTLQSQIILSGQKPSRGADSIQSVEKIKASYPLGGLTNEKHFYS